MIIRKYCTMKRKTFWFLLLVCIVASTGFTPPENEGEKLEEVMIGSQIWMKKNLEVSIFRNGDTISEAKSGEEWNKADIEKKPAWCYYNNDIENGKKYGKLYNWYAANDPRGLAPAGWHIPTEEEWWTLRGFLGGGMKNNGDKMKSATNDWYVENGKSCMGNDSSGFSGFPAGMRYGGTSEFRGLSLNGNWWSSTKKAPGAYYIQLIAFGGSVYGNPGSYSFGMSVRCIKNKKE